MSNKILSSLLPQHLHNNIHLSLSNNYFLKASWFSIFPFKWTNGLFSCKGNKPHFILNGFPCPTCSEHPLDPLSYLTFCPTTQHLRNTFINTWPNSFRKTIINWLSTASRGDARNFFKTLFPHSLSNILHLPPPGTTYYNHNTSLHKALQSRRKPLQKALDEIRQWFINNLIPHEHLQLTSSDNPWFIPNSCFSTSSPNPVKLTFPKRKPTKTRCPTN